MDAIRRMLVKMAVVIAVPGAVCIPQAAIAQQSASPVMKIGIIGSGRLGGTVGALWAKAGHQVMFSALDLDEVRKLAASVGPNASAGTPAEAARFGDVVLTALPYGALPQVGRDLAADLKGKIVLDASNPVPARDGEVGAAAKAKGAGLASAELLAGARLVRAFNSVGFGILQKQAHRSGERVAIPLAADDEGALKVAMQLVRDAGFEPLVVGPLSSAKSFDSGTPVFGKGLTAAELRRGLGIGN